MARRTKSDIIRLKKFIAVLMLNKPSEITFDGNFSPAKIAKVIFDELGEKVDEHTLAKWIEDKSILQYKEIIPPEENENIKSLKKRIAIAKAIADDKSEKAADRTKALNSFNALMKTKLQYEQMLADERIKKAEVSRPIHKIIFGHFKNVMNTCPKCGHKYLDEAYLKNKKEFGIEDDNDEK